MRPVAQVANQEALRLGVMATSRFRRGAPRLVRFTLAQGTIPNSGRTGPCSMAGCGAGGRQVEEVDPCCWPPADRAQLVGWLGEEREGLDT